jgi:hypothetical protein
MRQFGRLLRLPFPVPSQKKRETGTHVRDFSDFSVPPTNIEVRF